MVTLRKPPWLQLKPTLAENVGISEFNAALSNIQLVPNPAAETSTIKLLSTHSGELSIELYDLSGKLVTVIVSNASVNSGTHEFTINTNTLENGIYFVQVSNALAKQLLNWLFNTNFKPSFKRLLIEQAFFFNSVQFQDQLRLTIKACRLFIYPVSI